MRLISRQHLALASVFLLVLANIALFIYRSDTPSAPILGNTFDTTDARFSVLDQWHKARTIPFSEQVAIKDSLLTKQSSGFLDTPPGFVRLTLPEDDARVSSLLEALDKLVKAYASNDPGRILAFMRSHGQDLTDEMRDKAIAHYKNKTRADPESVDAAWVFYWRDWNYNPHWKDLVAGQTDVRYYAVPAEAHLTLRSLATIGEAPQELWRNKTSVGRHFGDADDFDAYAALGAHGSLTVADAHFVVSHDESVFRRRSPYVVRMWYCERDLMWKPIGMAKMKIDLTQWDKVVKLGF
jgi:hypothetical protein